MDKLKKLRLLRKMTQLQLAEKSGLSQSYINELENGKKINPSLESLFKLSIALDTTIMEIMEKYSSK